MHIKLQLQWCRSSGQITLGPVLLIVSFCIIYMRLTHCHMVAAYSNGHQCLVYKRVNASMHIEWGKRAEPLHREEASEWILSWLYTAIHFVSWKLTIYRFILQFVPFCWCFNSSKNLEFSFNMFQREQVHLILLRYIDGRFDMKRLDWERKFIHNVNLVSTTVFSRYSLTICSSKINTVLAAGIFIVLINEIS